jgi:hypothetical protein
MAGDRVDRLGLILASPPPSSCKVSQLTGQWVWKDVVSTDTSETWSYGCSWKHEESQTKEWQESLSVTIKQGWEFMGAEGGIEITGSMAEKTTNSVVDAMEKDSQHTTTKHFTEDDMDKSVWQFQFSTIDSCDNREDGNAPVLVTTRNHKWMPCCLPGYATDHFQAVCSEAAAMIPGGKEQGCRVASEVTTTHLINLLSGQCIQGADLGAKDVAGMHTCFESDTQDWELMDANDGSYQLRNKHSGKCMKSEFDDSCEYGKMGYSDDCQVQSDSQHWELHDNGDHTYRLYNKRTGSCLIAPSNHFQPIMWNCNGGNEQHWTIPGAPEKVLV